MARTTTLPYKGFVLPPAFLLMARCGLPWLLASTSSLSHLTDLGAGAGILAAPPDVNFVHSPVVKVRRDESRGYHVFVNTRRLPPAHTELTGEPCSTIILRMLGVL